MQDATGASRTPNTNPVSNHSDSIQLTGVNKWGIQRTDTELTVTNLNIRAHKVTVRLSRDGRYGISIGGQQLLLGQNRIFRVIDLRGDKPRTWHQFEIPERWTLSAVGVDDAFNYVAVGTEKQGLLFYKIVPRGSTGVHATLHSQIPLETLSRPAIKISFARNVGIMAQLSNGKTWEGKWNPA